MSSAKPTGGPAFPTAGNELARRQAEALGHTYTPPQGLTIRDSFAIAAIQGFCALQGGLDRFGTFASAAGAAYEMADAMLEARTK